MDQAPPNCSDSIRNYWSDTSVQRSEICVAAVAEDAWIYINSRIDAGDRDRRRDGGLLCGGGGAVAAAALQGFRQAVCAARTRRTLARGRRESFRSGRPDLCS